MEDVQLNEESSIYYDTIYTHAVIVLQRFIRRKLALNINESFDNKFPRLNACFALASSLTDFKNLDIKKYKDLECLFGFTCIDECRVFATMMRPLAINSKFVNRNLENLDVFVIRRKLDEDGNSMNDNYIPYPCKLKSIKNIDSFKYCNITIEGERGIEDSIHAERIFVKK